MTTQAPHPAGTDDAKRTSSADATAGRPAPVAVSPAIGPLPPIYVRQWPGEAGAPILLRHAAELVRRAGRRAFRRLAHHHAETPESDPQASPASHVPCQPRR